MSSKPVVVVKVGTSTLMDPISGLPSVRNMGNLVETVVDLKNRGYDVILVTSGAVGFGCKALGIKERPPTLAGKQAMAALGQSEIMRVYRMMFDMLNTLCAQLLITRTDFVHKTRYVNFKNTVQELLRLNVVPIINENDSAATEELRFGDNDSLGAHVAVLCDASWLFLLTDVDCLYTANPRTNPEAKAVAWVPNLASLRVDTGSTQGGTNWGTGGMATKMIAAQIATAAGVHTVLANGMHPGRVFQILAREDPKTKVFTDAPSSDELSNGGWMFPTFDDLLWPGTIFRGNQSSFQTLRTRRKWVLSLPVMGKVMVDGGAARALLNGNSLLAVGVTSVKGKFLMDDAVSIFAPTRSLHLGGSQPSLDSPRDGKTPVSVPPTPACLANGSVDPWDDCVEIARCLIAVSAQQLKQMRGRKGQALRDAVGFAVDPEVAHRPDIVILIGDDDEDPHSIRFEEEMF